MWMMTPIGFYSAVEHRDRPARVLVRARTREDLERLVALWHCIWPEANTAPIISETPGADYRWRIELDKGQWARLVARMAMCIDYPNFKGAVQQVDPGRAKLYHEVWSVMGKAQPGGPYAGGRTGHEKPACELCGSHAYSGRRTRRPDLTALDILICSFCEVEVGDAHGQGWDALKALRAAA